MSNARIDWEKTPLIPAIAQDYQNGDVLMLAYMNEEALSLTQQTKIAHYFSRSKQRIWKKGESSNHIQEVKDILIDCDNDTILLKVDQHGAACHTGKRTCFFTRLENDEIIAPTKVQTEAIYGVIDTLYHTILSRKGADPEESYTAKLFNKGENTILKKIVEEAGELCFAIKDNNSEEIIYECADLTYHVLVALGHKEISPDRIKQELAKRFGISGIEEKNSRPS